MGACVRFTYQFRKKRNKHLCIEDLSL